MATVAIALAGWLAAASGGWLLWRERRRRISVEQAAIAFEAQAAIVITDARQRILRVNRAFTRMTGYGQDEAVGRSTGRLLASGRHDAAFYAAMWAALRQHRHWQGEIWNRRKNGEIYPEWLSITALADDDGQPVHYVAVFADITQKQREEEAVRSMAYADALTGLPNRRVLQDRLQQALVSAQREADSLALLFIDIDHFKALNDSRGHGFGDQVLLELAQRLRRCVREVDTVARLGGDEFVVLLPSLRGPRDLVLANALLVARKIRDAARTAIGNEPHDVRVTLSIGVAIGGAGDTMEALMSQADAAMYTAKAAGRDTIRCSEAPPPNA